MGQKAEVEWAEVPGPKRSREFGSKSVPDRSFWAAPAGVGQKAKVEGKGLEGKGRGSNKGPITGAIVVSGRSGSHPLRLVSTSYAFPVSCHGSGLAHRTDHSR